MTNQQGSVYTRNNDGSGADVLKDFQLEKLSISQKSSPEFGLQLSKKIWGYAMSGIGGYYYDRNARFAKNRMFANGRIDVASMFKDRFQFDGKQNYIRLVWQTLQIVNRIISGLVGRWMARGEKIQVKATDSISVKEKEAQYRELEFLIAYRNELLNLQEQSGVQMMPDEGVPADKEELVFWQAQIQRLPEEILYEMGCNEVLQANGLFDVIKEKMLLDSAIVGFLGTYTWMDETGVIHVDWIKPENSIYAFSEFPDFRDASWLGDIPSLKISELRKQYGKEFNPNNPNALTEEQIWQVAQTAKEFKNYTNLTWDASWNGIFMRPYDEWNVRMLRFQLRTVDSEPYTITKTKKSGRTYTQSGLPKTKSGNKKEKVADNQEIIEDSNINIYEGMYLPDNDILLKWGLKKNMIRPQDPREIGNAEYSYSYYMYQNYELRNLAIPEKIEAAVDNMILTCLKIQQVIARMRPTGAAINEDALQNIDYGLGDAGNKSVDHKKLYDQTGDIYYRGRDAEGNPIPVPIQELANSGFLGQMDGLIRNYQFWYQTLKDELGEDPNLISAAAQPRVTAENVQASQSMQDNATDYMYRAFAECVKLTAKKVSCLLKDSVTYGSNVYRGIVNEQAVSKRIFNTVIQFIPTEQEVMRFEAIVNQTIASNPELLQFLDPFQLLRVAKEDVKLAELMFRQSQKKLIQYQQQTTQQAQQATFEAQKESAIVAEQEKRETEKVKGETLILLKETEGQTENKKAVVNMVTSLLSKGEQIPAQLQPIVNVVMENILIPLAVQNDEQKTQIVNSYKQAQMGQDQMAQVPEQQNIQQPQPQVAA